MTPIAHLIALFWNSCLILLNAALFGLGCALVAAIYYVLWTEGWF